MPDKAQLTSQIRFALEQLSERNAQHEWEHLCRHFARERICSNILPATGPVQAGGDQGRDFETFRTFLSQSPLRERSFVGLISERPLAFACTLQKAVKNKVKSDVTTIMSSGTSVEGVYFFCTHDLDVAKRHELQAWAQDTHSVLLEIFDGAAISELLAEPELFWLAERYLHLPSEFSPALTSEAAQDWYGRTLNKWRKNPNPAQSFTDFSEIRRATRKALGPMQTNEQGKPTVGYELPDLPFWIERLDEIAAHNTGGLLHRRSLYHATVARLRGLGSLVGQETPLRLYFALVPQLEDAADLEDAGALLSYIFIARGLGVVDVGEEEVAAWEGALENRLDEQLRKAKKEDRINEQCALLSVRGFVALLKPRNEGIMDAATAFGYWKRLGVLVARAPLFPLESFADNLAKFAEFLGSHPEYDALAESIDALVAERFGQFKAAEKCLTRAKAFINTGDLARAMTQIHRAKVDWFAKETLEQSLAAMTWLSGAYQEQGLLFAAKYYALAAAFVALHSPDLEIKAAVPDNLVNAAECDFSLGAWHGFLELAHVGTLVYSAFAGSDDDLNDPNGSLPNLAYHLALLPVLTGRLLPDVKAFGEARSLAVAHNLGLDDVVAETLPAAQETWDKFSSAELWQTIHDELAGVPWSDTGPTRRCQWSAHGVRWAVEWENDYATTSVAEEFLAALQIFLSDLAGHDLCLLRCSIAMTIRIASDDELTDGFKGFDMKSNSSNGSRKVVVRLPPLHRFKEGHTLQHDLQAGVLSIASALLSEVSLLPAKKFNAILNTLFQSGLPHKLMTGAPYHQCLNEFVSQEEFEASKRQSKPAIEPPASFAVRTSEQLPWFDGPGPRYESTPVQVVLERRYEKFALPVSRTLARLNADPVWQQTVQRLRDEGWKDWHLLAVVCNLVMNYRANQRRIAFSHPKLEMEANRRMMEQEETEDAVVVPLTEFGEEQLRQQMRIYMVTVLQACGLENHQVTPDFEGVADFLTHRYNFWNDDIEHTDPFDFANPNMDAPAQLPEASNE